MARNLDLNMMNLPEDWADDIRMNFLFAPFREKIVNPAGWEAKMKFWINFIQDLCVKCETPVINDCKLRAALERKGKYPQCLDIVLENMYNEGLITSLNNFSKLEPEKGWIGWGFDVLVQKPMSWGFNTVQGFLNWSKKEECFVITSVVKELAAKVLSRHKELVNSELTDNVRFLDTFEEQCKDICLGTNFNLAIIQLQKEKQIYVFEDERRKVIKFRDQGDKVKPLTELDKGILNLRSAKDKVLQDIDSLEEDIKSTSQEIKHHLKEGHKTKAMFSLKKKKRLEDILKKKTISLDNIESLLYQLQNSDSEKMVLAAYKAGAQAIKMAVKDDLNLDNIDVTMADVEGTLDDYEEVKRTLSKAVTPESEYSDELEEELNELLAAEKKENNAKNKQPSPARFSDDDLLRRLTALRTPPEGVPPLKRPATNSRLRESYAH